MSDNWKDQLVGLHIPRHIAIVMDGNGRWAQERGLPRVQGHFAGREATRRCIRACAQIGVGAISVYAFSVENWRRPADEVAGIMSLIEESLRYEIADLHAENVRLIASGRLHELSDGLQRAIIEGTEQTAKNAGMVLNLLINYGGRAEIVDTAQQLARRVLAGELSPDDFTEGLFAANLYSPDLPDPDLLIRPGREMRLSNFLLWEVAYAEIITMPVLWPDFEEQHLVEAIREFSQRDRRFGGVADDVKNALDSGL